MAANIYAFLELEGIEGESQDSQYTNKIELQSFAWGASNNSSFEHGTGASIGKGQIHDIACSKYTDKSSLKLFERAVNGKHINSGKVSLLKQSGDTKIPYLEIKLTNVAVTSFNLAAGSGGDLPVESFSLHFVKMHANYLPQGNEGDPTGNVDFGWNLQQNVAG
jgi:type VI secretion system secreted protein Hcp